MLYRDVIYLHTKTDSFQDVTERVAKIIEESKIRDGLCNVFVKGTTAGVMLNENDRMLIEDFRKLLATMAPDEHLYQHPENAKSHLRAAMIGNNITIPVADGKPMVGSWQNIILFEFDVVNREREVVVTIYGQ
ncbi:MAG TPA: secondary thiamine-phosphate synthase enzyme YjbQ [archaeon]|nr:secondary thiamine-phosphate synthase enzyme YjbQ [archaeon]